MDRMKQHAHLRQQGNGLIGLRRWNGVVRRDGHRRGAGQRRAGAAAQELPQRLLGASEVPGNRGSQEVLAGVGGCTDATGGMHDGQFPVERQGLTAQRQ